MSDDPRVTVPAELVDELREALMPGKWPAWGWDMKMRDAARALVDAAERPDEFVGHILTTHADPEEYARIHNEGYEAAILHEIAPDPTFADDWFAEQLRVAKFEAWWEGARAKSLALNPYDDPATPPPVPVSDEGSDHADCDHTCAVIVSDEDYQRSEGVCAGCGVRMKNDAKTGWGPSLPFGDVPCGSRVGECCPPHKFTNEDAPDVCDTCGDSEHPPVSDEAEAACNKCGHPIDSPDGCSECPSLGDAEAAWLKWVYENADLFNTDRLSFVAGFRAARQAGKDEQP